MSHQQDYWEGVRGFVIPKLGIFVQLLEDITGDNYYVQSTTNKYEFVGSVDMPEEEFEQVLHDLNFVRNPLAAWKHLFNDKTEHEEGSFRWIPPEDSDLNSKFQLHVIIYDGQPVQNSDSDTTFVFAHWEYRWDVHPIKHYRGVDSDAQRGVELMQQKLNEVGVGYDADNLPQ
jgi:hypothetical protein